MRQILMLIIIAVGASVGGGLTVDHLSDRAGAAPSCPTNSPNPPPRCRGTPTPTATATPPPTPTETSTSTPTPTDTPKETPTPSPSATPVPPSNDVLLAYDVIVGNHVQQWFGAYQPSTCYDAVIFMGASGLEPDQTTYDFLVAASDDGTTPRENQWQNIGNSTVGGSVGTWKTVRKVSLSSLGTSEHYDYNEPADAPYMLVGVFANQAHRFVADVHCTRTYP